MKLFCEGRRVLRVAAHCTVTRISAPRSALSLVLVLVLVVIYRCYIAQCRNVGSKASGSQPVENKLIKSIEKFKCGEPVGHNHAPAIGCPHTPPRLYSLAHCHQQSRGTATILGGYVRDSLSPDYGLALKQVLKKNHIHM